MPQFPFILTWKNSFPSLVYSDLSFSQATLSLLPERTIRNEAEDWRRSLVQIGEFAKSLKGSGSKKGRLQSVVIKAAVNYSSR